MPDALDKSSSNVASQKDKFEERFKSYYQLPCCIKFSSYTFLSFKKAPLYQEGLSSCLNFFKLVEIDHFKPIDFERFKSRYNVHSSDGVELSKSTTI